jgi:inositol 3-alpha-galactosyltransferase
MYTTNKISPEDLEVMRNEGCVPLAVDRFMPNNADTSGYKMSIYADCWTKLRIWELEQFSRVVYIDADMLVIRNMDHLFDLPQGFHAARDCYAGRPSCEERERCPLFGPECAGANCDYFNAGLFVCEPSRLEFQRMCELVAEASLFQKFGSGYAEQDFLNWYFRGNIGFLPYVFNAMKIIRHHHPEIWRLEEVHNIHYVDAKPWRRNDPSHAPYEDLNDLWWYIYDHQELPPHIASEPQEPQQPSDFTKPMVVPEFGGHLPSQLV